MFGVPVVVAESSRLRESEARTLGSVQAEVQQQRQQQQQQQQHVQYTERSQTDKLQKPRGCPGWQNQNKYSVKINTSLSHQRVMTRLSDCDGDMFNQGQVQTGPTSHYLESYPCFVLIFGKLSCPAGCGSSKFKKQVFAPRWMTHPWPRHFFYQSRDPLRLSTGR